MRHPRHSLLSECLATTLSNWIWFHEPVFWEDVKVFRANEPAPKGCQKSDFISYRVPWPVLQDTISRLDYIFLGYLENHCGFK